MVTNHAQGGPPNDGIAMGLKSKRLTFIDFARSYAVLLALLSHALITTGIFQRLGNESLYIKQFIRMATPMFVFMFGFMIEFVYVNKVRQEGTRSILKRVYLRSLQCYGAYGITSLSGVLGGYKSWSEFLGSLVFLSDSRFGNILRVYALLLLIVPVLIRLRLKYGSKFLLLALFMIIGSFPVLTEWKQYSMGSWDHPLNIIFGIGPEYGGPSVWHSLSFLLAGMYLASSLRATQRPMVNFYQVSILLILSSAVLGLVLIEEPLAQAWWKFADFTYRGANLAGYYLIGIVCSVVFLALFAVTIGTRSLPLPFKYLLPFGQSSLLYYTLGNVLLNIFGPLAHQLPGEFVLLWFFMNMLIFSILLDGLSIRLVVRRHFPIRLGQTSSG